MPTVPVYNAEGETVGELALAGEVFAAPASVALLHQAVVGYLANQRQGTHATKTRGQVSGGGRKPWRQKGTGRARQGSIRAPHWKGGGIVFGPQPRDHRQRLPVRLRRQALRGALSAKVADGNIRVLDQFGLTQPKTGTMVRILDHLRLGDTRSLLVTAGPDEAVYLSARNLPDVAVLPATDLNAYAVLRARSLVLTVAAVQRVEEVFGKCTPGT